MIIYDDTFYQKEKDNNFTVDNKETRSSQSLDYQSELYNVYCFELWISMCFIQYAMFAIILF